jgi:methionyl-tRNA synthetase
MSEKYIDGRIPAVRPGRTLPASGASILSKLDRLAVVIDTALDKLDFIAALQSIWEVIGDANKFVEETKPWQLKKEGRGEELEDFLSVMFLVLRQAAVALAPFMPQTSAKILSQLKGDRVAKGDPLFPRIVEEKE